MIGISVKRLYDNFCLMQLLRCFSVRINISTDFLLRFLASRRGKMNSEQ